MAHILKAHAKFCTKIDCKVLHCAKFKMEFRKERVKQKFQHNRCLQRRMRMMMQQMSVSDPEKDGVESGEHEGQMEVE